MKIMATSSSSWFHRRNSTNGIFNSKGNNSINKISSAFSYLVLKNITYGYVPHKPIIENINLLIPRGRFVGLVGPSGSGKSTLVKIIAGLIKPWGGSVEYSYASANNTGNDIEIGKASNKSQGQKEIDNFSNSPLHPSQSIPKNRNGSGNGSGIENGNGNGNGNNSAIIGYVPQIETVDWNFPVTVKEVVGMGAWDKSGVTPFFTKDIVSEIDQALDSLGIHSREFGKRQIRELSGGEQQRVFLARALVRRPSILLLDEPTSGVDHNTQEKILNILISLSLVGITIIMTTHDLSGIAKRLQWVVCMNKRIIAEGYPREVLTDRNLLRTYGLGGDGDNNTDDVTDVKAC
jgi:ABC-type Mn2+/Zn2+ transport system ATPase subunit